MRIRQWLRTWTLPLLAYGVAGHGLLLIAGVLEDNLSLHVGRHVHVHINHLVFNAPILLGLGLLYIALLVRRGKRTAWIAAMVVYGLTLAVNVLRLIVISHDDHLPAWLTILRDLVLPLVVVSILIWRRKAFTVRSDVRGFRSALLFSGVVLVATLVYGVLGFTLLDQRDFHQEISPLAAVHQTIDQFGLTGGVVMPQTRRAHLFVDSLSLLSTGACMYAVISFFQPLRARLSGDDGPRHSAEQLIAAHSMSSEDFFKLWPQDKHYFFNLNHTAGLAYGVSRGMAVVVGDPFGDPQMFKGLVRSFDVYCRTNDWKAAYIHTEPAQSALYTASGFALQKIGEEAVLDVGHFTTVTASTKYFRHIRNRFERNGYTAEMLEPPHNDAIIKRLQAVSDDWLRNPGREERGFALGYFNAAYMQQCRIMVLRDAAGTIQAFINQVPTYMAGEANFDLLRYTGDALGNANDYLLMSFIAALHADGLERVNLGLCLLAGIGDQSERSLIDRTLGLVYAKGDRIYSFSGLHRFKRKYEPVWSERYIAYRGGAAGLTRAAVAFSKLSKI